MGVKREVKRKEREKEGEGRTDEERENGWRKGKRMEEGR